MVAAEVPGTTGPVVIVLDVNETLSDMAAMGGAFAAARAPADLAPLWFAGVLRDGFALTAAGAAADFATIARENLVDLLSAAPHEGTAEAAADRVMAGFAELRPHPDTVPGLRALASAGHRLVTLSNGSTAVADGLLSRAGVRDLVERLLSVQDASRWKPAPESYAVALSACGVRPHEAMLVAVHPWDVDGAARAGLRTAWIDRTGRRYPPAFTRPDLTAASLVDLAAQLAA